MKIRISFSKPGALEGEGSLRHVRAPSHLHTLCNRFVPAGGWEPPVEMDVSDGRLPFKLRRSVCLPCMAEAESLLAVDVP